MKLFGTIERQNISDYIEKTAKENEHIVSLIAVGSGAYGYNDELSDLDFVVAVDSDENVSAVKEYISARIKEKHDFIYFKQPEHIPMQVYMLDNFLEIDIGFGAYTSACAFKAHWKVLFDKSGTVDEAMKRTWDSISNAPKTDAHNAKLAECSDMVWHHLMHAAVAIKRKLFWRASGEMDCVRNMLIELLGMRYSLETTRGKDVDKLPETELSALQKTMVTELSAKSLWSSLDSLADTVYSELERYGENAKIKVSRTEIVEYINSCKQL